MDSCFDVNQDILDDLDRYHEKSMLMEKHAIEKAYHPDLESAVDDDLIYRVPIYDMGSRRYAAFCSFTEAIWRKEADPKGNGMHFSHVKIASDLDWFFLLYAFRLCGSGINYKPKTNTLLGSSFIGTHGFGNFWIVNELLSGRCEFSQWIESLRLMQKPFTDNRGYLLPQFSYNDQSDGHLKRYIITEAPRLAEYVLNKCVKQKLEIYQVTDLCNEWLVSKGYRKQNFVATAFAADLAEYFPNYVDSKSMVYAGTNAQKCINLIFRKTKKMKDFDFINSVLRFQSNRYGLNPIDCEDSRNCDPIRYWQEFQSKHHVSANSGKIMKNNSLLKSRWSRKKYEQWKISIK
jgi:hypothetical protein